VGHQVVIKFLGLCIHVHKSDFPQLPARHRVIFLSNDAEHIQEHAIEPHHPELTFLGTPPAIDLPCLESRGDGVFRLHGVRMRITNGLEPLALNETFDHVPHLTLPLGGVLPSPKLDVILNGAAPAAAYFDVDHGAFFACQATPRGALGTTLVIDTGDELPKLELSCFGTQIIELGPKPRLYVTNVAANGQDDDSDYLLNYRILESIPPDPPPPSPNLEGLGMCAPDLDLDFGPPCSNSNYP
jgi:hypothetical protein